MMAGGAPLWLSPFHKRSPEARWPLLGSPSGLAFHPQGSSWPLTLVETKKVTSLDIGVFSVHDQMTNKSIKHAIDLSLYIHKFIPGWRRFTNTYPPDGFAMCPCDFMSSITLSRKFPWIRISLFLTVSPTPHFFFSLLPIVFIWSWCPINPFTMVTILPPGRRLRWILKSCLDDFTISEDNSDL